MMNILIVLLYANYLSSKTRSTVSYFFLVKIYGQIIYRLVLKGILGLA